MAGSNAFSTVVLKGRRVIALPFIFAKVNLNQNKIKILSL